MRALNAHRQEVSDITSIQTRSPSPSPSGDQESEKERRSEGFERPRKFVDQVALDRAWELRRHIDAIEQEAESQDLSFQETMQRVASEFPTTRQASSILRRFGKLLKKSGIPGGVSSPVVITREAVFDRMPHITRPAFGARRELLASALENSPTMDFAIEETVSRVSRVSRIKVPRRDGAAGK